MVTLRQTDVMKLLDVSRNCFAKAPEIMKRDASAVSLAVHILDSLFFKNRPMLCQVCFVKY